MRTIYLDKDFICHEEADEGRRKLEVDEYLDSVPDLSCIRFVPMGEVWTRVDGTEFPGLMITRVALE